MDAVVATSGKTAAYLDVPATVVMHGIDPERFSPAADIRARFSAAMSEMYRKEVPAYGTLMDLVAR